MRRRHLLRSATAAAIAVPVLGPSRGSAQALEKVSIGVLKLASSGPLFIAMARGHFRAQGLEVEPKYFTAAAQVPVSPPYPAAPATPADPPELPPAPPAPPVVDPKKSLLLRNTDDPSE